MASENTKTRRRRTPDPFREQGSTSASPPGGRPTALAGLYAAVLDDYVAALAGRRSRPNPAHLSVEGAQLPRLARRRRVDGDPLHTPAAETGPYATTAPTCRPSQTRPAHRSKRLAAVDDSTPPRPGRRECHRADLPKSAPRALSRRTAYGSCARSSSALPARPGPRPDPVLRRRPHRRDRRPGRRRRQISAARAPSVSSARAKRSARSPSTRRCVPYSPTAGRTRRLAGAHGAHCSSTNEAAGSRPAAPATSSPPSPPMPTSTDEGVSGTPTPHLRHHTRPRSTDLVTVAELAGTPAWRPPGRTACPPTRTRPKP